MRTPISSQLEMGGISSQNKEAGIIIHQKNQDQGGRTLDPLSSGPEENEFRRRVTPSANKVDSKSDLSSINVNNITNELEENDEVEDPHAFGLGGNLTSTIMGIIKAMVGPAILYLPHGFATCGYALAIPILAVATSMFLYAAQCLLDAWKAESLKAYEAINEEQQQTIAGRSRALTYPELANRAMGLFGQRIVEIGIALMQSGVCLTYLIFVPKNLQISMRYLANINLDARIWLIIMVLIEVPLSWINDIRKLTCTNFSANVLILYGLMLCMGFAFDEAMHESMDVEDKMAWYKRILNRLTHLEPYKSEWFLFIGTSVLLFEGSITLLVPLQESVILEEERQQFPTVYRQVILSIISFYVLFGITCWASFGSNVHTVLTTSLPSGMFATSVQMAYSFAVIMTFPLQNFPALEIATKSISFTLVENLGFKKNGFFTKRYVISSVLVLSLAIVAATTMDSLDKVVSLMGALLGCPIAFVVPPIIHTKLCGDGSSRLRLICNKIVATAGVLAMVLASIATVVNWDKKEDTG